VHARRICARDEQAFEFVPLRCAIVGGAGVIGKTIRLTGPDDLFRRLGCLVGFHSRASFHALSRDVHWRTIGLNQISLFIQSRPLICVRILNMQVK